MDFNLLKGLEELELRLANQSKVALLTADLHGGLSGRLRWKRSEITTWSTAFRACISEVPSRKWIFQLAPGKLTSEQSESLSKSYEFLRQPKITSLPEPEVARRWLAASD